MASHRSASFPLTDTEQALRIDVRDLLLFVHVDRHLIKELSSGFHAAVWMVRGEDDAIDTDRIHHSQIRLVRQTPALIHRARLLVQVFAGEDSSVEVFPHVFLDASFQPTILLMRESVVRPPRRPAQYLQVMAHNDLQRRKPVEYPAQDQAEAVHAIVDVPTRSGN